MLTSKTNTYILNNRYYTKLNGKYRVRYPHKHPKSKLYIFFNKLLIVPLILIVLISVSLVTIYTKPGTKEGIIIDGNFDDWSEIYKYPELGLRKINNANVDIINFGFYEEEKNLFIYLKTKGQLLSGRALDSQYFMDEVRIFIDTDDKAETGYYISNLGAEFMINVAGFNGSVYVKQLWQFSGNEQRNFSNFQIVQNVNAYSKNSELEIQIEKKVLNLREDYRLIIHTLSADGVEDFEYPVAKNKNTIVMVTESLLPEVVNLDNTLIMKVEPRIFGTQNSKLNTLEFMATNEITSKIFLTFDSINVSPQVSNNILKFVVPQPITGYALLKGNLLDIQSGKVFGLKFYNGEVNNAIIFNYTKKPAQGAFEKTYIQKIPTNISIDGAFADWNNALKIKNNQQGGLPNLDIQEFSALSQNLSTDIFFYLKVESDLFVGTNIPRSSVIAVVSDGGNGTIPPPIVEEIVGYDYFRIFISNGSGSGFYIPDYNFRAAYHVQIIGKEKSIFSKKLFSYTGNGTSWAWTEIQDLSVEFDSFQLELSVPRIFDNENLSFIFETSNWNAKIKERTQPTKIYYSVNRAVELLSLGLIEITNGTGDYANDQFGFSVSYAGDINNDGYADIAVGAPYYDFNLLLIDSGALYIFYGSPTLQPGDIVPSNANIVIFGSVSNELFGYSVAYAGDVNGGGVGDIIVGAPGNTSSMPGEIWLFYGENGIMSGWEILSADVYLQGYFPGSKFGYSVSGAGDVNNDGKKDVLVGAPDNGKAYIFYGSSTMAEDFNINNGGVLDDNFIPSTISDAKINATGAPDYRAQKIYPSRPIITKVELPVNVSSGETPSANLEIRSNDFSVHPFRPLTGSSNLSYIINSSIPTSWTGSWTEFDIPDTTVTPSEPYWLSLTYTSADSNITWKYPSSYPIDTDTAFSSAKPPSTWSTGTTNILGYKVYTSGANVTFSGKPEDKFGYSVSSAGDVNNDGYDDVLVGSYLNDSLDGSINDGGATYIFLGSAKMVSTNVSRATIHTELNESPDSQLIYFGDAWAQQFRPAKPVLDAIELRFTTPVSSIRIQLRTNNTTITGGPSNTILRESVVSITSARWTWLDFDDVILNLNETYWVVVANDTGTPDDVRWSSKDTGATLGDTYYFNNSSQTWSPSSLHKYFTLKVNYLASNETIYGSSPNEKFSWSLANISDINTDGYDDIVANSVGTQNGTLYILKGKTTQDMTIGTTSTMPVTRINGTNNGDMYGYAVTGLGLFNSDVYPDFAVSAPYFDGDGKIDNGAIYLIFGGPYLIGFNGTALDANYTFFGVANYEHLGKSISFAGNINGDATSDILIGSPEFNNSTVNYAGKAYVVTPEFTVPWLFLIVVGGVWLRKRFTKISSNIYLNNCRKR